MKDIQIALQALKFGGIMIYPLALLAVLAVVIVLDKTFVYWRFMHLPRPLLERVETHDFSWSGLEGQLAGLDRRNYFMQFIRMVMRTAKSRSGG